MFHYILFSTVIFIDYKDAIFATHLQKNLYYCLKVLLCKIKKFLKYLWFCNQKSRIYKRLLGNSFSCCLGSCTGVHGVFFRCISLFLFLLTNLILNFIILDVFSFVLRILFFVSMFYFLCA